MSQYLQTNTGKSLTDTTAGAESPAADPFSSKSIKDATESLGYGDKSMSSSSASSGFYRQDPRKAAAAAVVSGAPAASATPQTAAPGSDTSNTGRGSNFEFFTRQITETKHPAPQALDDKLTTSSHVSTPEDSFTSKSANPPSMASIRKSIYEWSGSEDEDDSRGGRGQSGSSDGNDDSQDSRGSHNTMSAGSKDKDMRISSIFINNDYSNGDIDLRLPFKPVMANYIPATEIDASITSHAPIVYKVILRKYYCKLF